MPTPENHDPSRGEQKPDVAHSTEGLSEADYFNRASTVEDPELFVQSCLNEFFFEPLRPGIQLEIGFGREPFNDEKSYALPFHNYSAASPYVGIDGGTSTYVQEGIPGWQDYSIPVRRGILKNSIAQAEHIKATRKDKEFINFIIGDAKVLPLRDNSVQSVYLRDVLLTTGVVGADMHKMFQEFQRVMKPGGLMMIVESESQAGREASEDWGDDDSNHIVLGRALQAAGFNERATQDQFIFARKTTEKDM